MSGHRRRRDSKQKDNQDNQRAPAKPSSTTSLGKRRSLRDRGQRAPSRSPDVQSRSSISSSASQSEENPKRPAAESMAGQIKEAVEEYGSQASSMRPAAASERREINKVAVLGAAGGIGQPLCLLLMLHNEFVQHVALYDVAVSVQGVALELSHIDRQCKVTAHCGPDQLAEAVRGAKVILIPAGLAQKPGMSRDDLFGSNAKIVYSLIKVCAQVAPEAHLAIISNPVNSLVPMACEVYERLVASSAHKNHDQKGAAKQHGHQHQAQNQSQQHHVSDCCRRIYGVTTLDVVRASTLTARSGFFKAEHRGGLAKDPAKIKIPVVGGHAGKTILPLLSLAQPKLDKKRLLEDKVTTHTLIESIQQAGIEVLNAKKGAGTATLSMAYAACRFAIALLRAQMGEPNIIECAYVKHCQPVNGELDYFALPLQLGKDGYVRVQPQVASLAAPKESPAGAGASVAGGSTGAPSAVLALGKLLPFELEMVEEACRELRTSVAKGEDFAREQLSADKL